MEHADEYVFQCGALATNERIVNCDNSGRGVNLTAFPSGKLVRAAMEPSRT